MDEIKLKIDLVNALLQYLGSRPFVEVAGDSGVGLPATITRNIVQRVATLVSDHLLESWQEVSHKSPP